MRFDYGPAGRRGRFSGIAADAAVVFQEALSQGRVVGDLFERIGEYYRRHWFTPGGFELGIMDGR